MVHFTNLDWVIKLSMYQYRRKLGVLPLNKGPVTCHGLMTSKNKKASLSLDIILTLFNTK